MSMYNLNLGDYELSYIDTNTMKFKKGNYHIIVKPVHDQILNISSFDITLFHNDVQLSKKYGGYLDYALAHLSEISKVTENA